MTPNITTFRSKLAKITNTVTRGPVDSNHCPINQGITIPPLLPPTKNQAVVLPVVAMCRPANEIIVGKMDAIENPTPNVPIHSAAGTPGHTMTTRTLSKHPSRSANA